MLGQASAHKERPNKKVWMAPGFIGEGLISDYLITPVTWVIVGVDTEHWMGT